MFSFWLFPLFLVMNLFLFNFNALDYGSFPRRLDVDYSCIGFSINSFIMLACPLVLFSFVGVEDVLGKMPVLGDSPNFVAVLILLDQLFAILLCSCFSGVDAACGFPSNVLPESEIHVLRAWQKIVWVDSVLNSCYYLHSLGVIDLSTSPGVKREYPKGTVKRTSYELSAWRSIVQVSYCSYMVLVDCPCWLHLPEVKGVTVRVITAQSQVDWFKGIEA